MKAEGLPSDYTAVRGEGVEAFAWAPLAGWLERALQEEGTLYDWAGPHAVDELRGRGPVHVVPAPLAGPDGGARWAVRHYRRGGRVAPVLGDRYLGVGPARPLRELRACVLARARGVRTVAVVAGAVYREGWSRVAALYRADVATELVPHGVSLAELVRGYAHGVADSLRDAARLVRSLERAGLVHTDLNAGNVVLDRAGNAWAIDLDRARVRGSGGPIMFERLARSLRKLERSRGSPLSRPEWEAYRAGFEERE